MSASAATAPIWERYRDQFPVTRNLIYANHAAVGPLSKPAADEMKRLTDDACEFGSLHYDKWLAGYDRLRAASARLINARPSEIAIVKNTSEGISTVALGLDWRPGDKIVAFREEFPANYFPWKRLESRGVHIEWLSYADSLSRIDEAARGARLLAVSFVQFLSGYRIDLVALGEICERRGAFFFVDAIQGLGVFPLDVRECRIHALAADGHKWLLGPEGCGILYVQSDCQDAVEPVEFGWTNIAGFNDYSCRDMALRQDAGRYECGTLNTVGCFGLAASIEFLLQVGIPEIGMTVTELTDRVARGAKQRGYEVLRPRAAENASGVISFRKAAVDARVVVRMLKEKKILAAPRQSWVRISPHFYISPAEIDNIVDALP